MMRAIWILAVAVAGCQFSGEFVAGYDCSDGRRCPDGQVCSMATNTCEVPGMEQPMPEPVAACAQDVAASVGHTCTVRSDGAVWCWGINDASQLGDGTTVDAAAPVRVKDLPAAKAVVTGASHSCALLVDGQVMCWGHGAEGQLGTGRNNDSSVPVQVVAGTARFSELAAGDAHTCARECADAACSPESAGRVWCWGGNGAGQLGNNTRVDNATPASIDVTPGAPLTALRVVAGGSSACAIDATHRLMCWGRGAEGQLGTGVNDDKLVPTFVVADVTSVDIGATHMCAIQAGQVRCSGRNSDGQLGLGRANSLTLLSPQIAATFSAVQVGERHTCALADGGRVWCWGGNDFGESSDEPTSIVTPREANFADDVVQLAAAEHYTCVRTMQGVIECAGYNSRGQLGNGQQTTSPKPQQVPELTGIDKVAAGDQFSCGIQDRKVWCWGENDGGELADGTLVSRVKPALVEGLSDVELVVAGDDHACALVRPPPPGKGSVWCWGANGEHQLGVMEDTDDRTSPVLVAGLDDPTQLAAGDRHNCAVDGTAVKCWGANGSLQLGDSNPSSNDLNTLTFNESVLGVAAGSSHSCALLMNGTKTATECWGHNGQGQLGRGASADDGNSSVPLPVVVAPSGAPLEDATRIFAHNERTYAIRGSTKSLSAWGDGCRGLLGDNLGCAKRPAAVQINLTGVDRVTAGKFVTCAVLADVNRSVRCWGPRDDGQLGDGSYDGDTAVPTLVNDVSAADIAAGDAHVCVATRGSGDVFCWGNGGSGQLGFGELHDTKPAPAKLVCE